MIFFLVGLPSSFAEWCNAAVAELARRSNGTVEFVAADAPDSLVACAVKSRASYYICRCTCPNGQLRKIIADTDARFLFIPDEPRAAVAYLTLVYGKDAVNAAKDIANICASSIYFSNLRGGLRLNPDRDTVDLVNTAKVIADHFGFTVSASELPDIVAAAQRSAPIANRPAIDTWWNGLDTETRLLIAGVLDGYGQYFSTGKLGALVWRRGLFVCGDSGKPVNGAIELTGRSRVLVYGPYIMLPSGPWKFRVVFGCSKEAAGVNLLLDVYGKAQLCQFMRFQPKSGGIFEVTLESSVDEPENQFIEVRIFSEKAVFDGRLGFSGVTIIPKHESQMINDPALAAELDLQFA